MLPTRRQVRNARRQLTRHQLRPRQRQPPAEAKAKAKQSHRQRQRQRQKAKAHAFWNIIFQGPFFAKYFAPTPPADTRTPPAQTPAAEAKAKAKRSHRQRQRQRQKAKAHAFRNNFFQGPFLRKIFCHHAASLETIFVLPPLGRGAPVQWVVAGCMQPSWLYAAKPDHPIPTS